MEGIFMSVNEQIRLRIIEDFRAGRISRENAALKLSVSPRQITRLAKKVRNKGVAGIVHGNRQRLPVNAHLPSLKAWYVETYRSKYSAFNFSHALEMIALHEEAPRKVCYSTFRKWCRAEGLGKVRRRRTSKARLRRERSANEGFMLQLDGSPHKWNGKDEWCLIAMIDDATSTIPSAMFFESETTWGCMNVLRDVILKHGVPEVILTDCAGWSTGSLKRESFSQFARACDELGIKLIGTPSAEAKGRIERLFRTTQDRLVPEFQLYGIKTMVDANRYLQQCYLPYWKEHLAVAASSPENRYQKLPQTADIDKILCIKHTRTINRDHTFSFRNETYKIMPRHQISLWKRQLTIHEHQDGSFAFYCDGARLETSKLKPQRHYQRRA